MGGGVAQVAAQRGYEVVVVEKDAAAAEAGQQRVTAGLDRQVGRGRISADDKQTALDKLRFGTDLESISEADLIVEAVYEDVELKKALLARIDAIVGPETLIGSNTSTIPLVILAGATTRPEAIIGVHFFNPVPVMKLVEVIRTPISRPENIDAFVTFARDLGKTPVVINDVPGFVGNLLVVPFLLDAIRAFERGVAPMESIDEVLQLGFNHRMGPFRLSDLIGLDIVHDMAASMYEEYKDPRYFPPPLLKQYVRLGWLGQKTGRGFYTYDS
ncbi:3-hydroxyacyl-CoA dehydrogenase family protein [Cryptosporangium phraense]|uniref:3-hydroxyacyl-CoA dehydrogenase family protein n=2 Tax=Cryptosporangium phraense TaxID=2593070 RepID=A0A545B0M7_9ACTN|nr:3-hydroxyacyl-CoA dehydrogenase family protein [Cryptosporangium phraense]